MPRGIPSLFPTNVLLPLMVFPVLVRRHLRETAGFAEHFQQSGQPCSTRAAPAVTTTSYSKPSSSLGSPSPSPVIFHIRPPI